MKKAVSDPRYVTCPYSGTLHRPRVNRAKLAKNNAVTAYCACGCRSFNARATLEQCLTAEQCRQMRLEIGEV